MVKNSSYQHLARFYPFCERVIFGNALQNCRCTFIKELPQKVLSVGEGDGRFSQALYTKRPDIPLEVIELDAAMRKEALKRSPQLNFATPETASPCDALILNFVLDLFTEKDAQAFLDQLPEAKTIIIGDFFPNSLPTKTLTRLMYLFFRLTTGLKTTQIPPINKILQERGYTLQKEETQWKGYIRSQWWEKNN